jgi:hypothetical protein
MEEFLMFHWLLKFHSCARREDAAWWPASGAAQELVH